MADLERAMALLHKVVMTDWRQGIHDIALTELNRLWARADALDADDAESTTTKKVSRPTLHPDLVANLAVDLRVALSWDADATDVDLWVLEPSGEKAFMGTRETLTATLTLTLTLTLTRYPPVYKDISFWLPEGFEPNDFFELVS